MVELDAVFVGVLLIGAAGVVVLPNDTWEYPSTAAIGEAPRDLRLRVSGVHALFDKGAIVWASSGALKLEKEALVLVCSPSAVSNISDAPWTGTASTGRLGCIASGELQRIPVLGGGPNPVPDSWCLKLDRLEEMRVQILETTEVDTDALQPGALVNVIGSLASVSQSAGALVLHAISIRRLKFWEEYCDAPEKRAAPTAMMKKRTAAQLDENDSVGSSQDKKVKYLPGGNEDDEDESTRLLEELVRLPADRFKDLMAQVTGGRKFFHSGKK